jgi:hypothetical protein
VGLTLRDIWHLEQKVSEFGTDFQMIAYCFPGRSRNMIKNKYNRESQLYGGRLEEALATRKPVGESLAVCPIVTPCC